MRDSWTLGRTAALHGARWPAARPRRCRCPSRAPATIRPTARKMVYSPRFRDFRPEKRYGGGQANDLFIFDLKTNDAKRIIDRPALRPRPDVDRQHDLLQLRPRRHVQPLRLRRRERQDRRRSRPARSGTCAGRAPTAQGRIVYELNGELQVLDMKTGKSTPIPITVPDDGLWKRPSRVSGRRPDRGLRAVSPKGERALFTARGDIFTAPDREGPDAQPDRTPRARTTSGPRWSPDGVEDRLHLRHAAARRSCTSSRRTARASPSS